jgi:membrane associated rhomboid family serine protease
MVPVRHYAYAWLGSLIYALVLLGVAAAISFGWGRLDAFEAGSLNAALVRQGQWWRAWTSLTLHLDAAHIAANLGAGAWFGYLAGRLLGPGTAWALVVLGAGAANWVESLLAAADHRSVGASTAVFTALGLLAAYTWRERHSMALRPAQRYGPLFAGVILLGWLGTSGERTCWASPSAARWARSLPGPAGSVSGDACLNGWALRSRSAYSGSPGPAHSPPVRHTRGP